MATVNAIGNWFNEKIWHFRTAASYMATDSRGLMEDDSSTRQADANQSPYGYGYRNNGEKFSWQLRIH